MNRRGFLSTLLAAPAVAVAPKQIIPALLHNTPRRFTIRTGLPSPQWRKLNAGISPHILKRP